MAVTYIIMGQKNIFILFFPGCDYEGKGLIGLKFLALEAAVKFYLLEAGGGEHILHLGALQGIEVYGIGKYPLLLISTAYDIRPLDRPGFLILGIFHGELCAKFDDVILLIIAIAPFKFHP